MDKSLYTTESPLTSAEKEAKIGVSMSSTSHLRITSLKEPCMESSEISYPIHVLWDLNLRIKWVLVVGVHVQSFAGYLPQAIGNRIKFGVVTL